MSDLSFKVDIVVNLLVVVEEILNFIIYSIRFDLKKLYYLEY